MKIFTSRYYNYEIAQTDLIPVSISIGNPRFKTAFKINHKIKALAPTYKMLQMEHDPYKELYFQMLDALDINELMENFKAISKSNNNTTLPHL